MDVRDMCRKYGIHPSKKLGQNFLIDGSVARIMIEHANLTANDVVVEVGPGLGALTGELSRRVKKVLAVETDKKMVEALREVLRSTGSPGASQRVEVVHGDILKIPNSKLTNGKNYKVVASLPYSITSAVLRKFTEANSSLRDGAPSLSDDRPTLLVVLVQKEVAERVCAGPGKMSVLSVAVQYYGKPEIVAYVPASAFWPKPEVDSAILRIAIPVDSPQFAEVDTKRLFQLVKIGFSSRRKQLKNNLAAGLRISSAQAEDAIKTAGFEPKVRAQELAVGDWIKLAAKGTSLFS